jgi:hypothetical protein
MKKILRSAFMACALLVATNSAWSQTQAPYNGTPAVLPGTIEAENFDTGGNGVSFYDITVANSGGQYRNEYVDIQTCSEGGYNVYKIETYEWLEYTVNVSQSANYSFEFRVASTNAAGKIEMTMDGISIGSVNIPNTGGMQTWQTVKQSYGGVGTALNGGVHVLRLSFSNTETHYDMFNLNKVVVTKEPLAQLPYSGTPVALPGTFEAENFDFGGLGMAYYDVTTSNVGGKHRPTESVDIQDCVDGGFNIYRIDTYEWLEYTVNLSETSGYTFEFKVASTNSAGTIDLTLDGQPIGSVKIPNTGGMQTWRKVKHTYGGFGKTLSAGVHVLRLSFSNTETHYDMFNIDKVTVTKATRFEFTRLSIPGVVEAENYDIGAISPAYLDLTSANQGGLNRSVAGISLTESVDMEACSEGGTNIGWIQAGEWLEYTIHVMQEDIYTIAARVASNTSLGSFQLVLDGNTITNVIPVSYTGGWQNWSTITLPNMTLTAGTHILRIKMTGSEFNLNKLTFTKSVVTPGCTGIYNSDYSYVVSSAGTNPTITFNPIIQGAGSNYVILYYGTGTGSLPGYYVAAGVPYQINATTGQNVRFYYTYSYPTGGERSSVATPHNVTIGTCGGSQSRLSAIESSATENAAMYPNPMGETDFLNFVETGKIVSVKVLNATGIIVMEQKEWNTESPLNLATLDNGIYHVITNDGSESKTYKIVR